MKKLTHDQIYALSGRKLDCVVARHVMGWIEIEPEVNDGLFFGKPPEYNRYEKPGMAILGINVPYFSTNEQDALAIRDKLGLAWIANYDPRKEPKDKYVITFFVDTGNPGKIEGNVQIGFGETFPIAICRAALMFVHEVRI